MHVPHTQMECASVHTDLLLRPLRAEREHIDTPQCLHTPMPDNTFKKSDFFLCLGFCAGNYVLTLLSPNCGL